jgi:hypothetical protein
VFEDNKDCLELIEGRVPPGILALIDEQCLVKGGADDDKAKGRAEAALRGIPDEPVVTQADQNLAGKLYKNLEVHGRFLVDKKDRVCACICVCSVCVCVGCRHACACLLLCICLKRTRLCLAQSRYDRYVDYYNCYCTSLFVALCCFIVLTAMWFVFVRAAQVPVFDSSLCWFGHVLLCWLRREE